MPNKKNWDDLEIGALWRRSPKDKSKSDFYSGYFFDEKGNKKSILIFINKKKKRQNQPDLRIYKDNG